MILIAFLAGLGASAVTSSVVVGGLVCFGVLLWLDHQASRRALELSNLQHDREKAALEEQSTAGGP